MNLGTLATIADQRPENYLLTIIDNGVYGSTGGQPTFASRLADLASIARGAGVRMVRVSAETEVELESALETMTSRRHGVEVDQIGMDFSGRSSSSPRARSQTGSWPNVCDLPGSGNPDQGSSASGLH